MLHINYVTRDKNVMKHIMLQRNILSDATKKYIIRQDIKMLRSM